MGYNVRLVAMRIKNFRSILDETICFDVIVAIVRAGDFFAKL